LKRFLHQRLYFSPALEPEKDDAEKIIQALFAYWVHNPEALPSSYQEKARTNELARVVCDYIAGMTDTYIYEQHEKHVAG
jgi:dGTPase